MIRRIEIKNFKSFKYLDYTSTKLNLLMGLNGAGKSSLIQLLRLMSSVAGTIEDPVTYVSVKDVGYRYEDIVCRYSRKQEKVGCSLEFDWNGSCYKLERVLSSERGGDWICVGHMGWSEEWYHLDSVDIKCLRDESCGLVVSSRKRRDDAAKRYNDKMMCWRKDDEKAAKAFYSMWKRGRFIGAFRSKPHEIHPGGKLTSIEDDVDSFNSEGSDVIEYIHKYFELPKPGEPFSMRTGTLLDEVNGCLQWISPGASLQIEDGHVEDAEYQILSIAYGSNELKYKFKPQHVGFGISYILPVLAALLTAQKGNIITIENPEAHLHPRGQAEIGKLIAQTVARGVQVFVETHSDHVVNGIRVAVKKGIIKPEDVNIAFFERGPHEVEDEDGLKHTEIYSEVRNIKVEANGSLSEYPPDFMDEWNILQMKLLRRK